MMPLSCDCYPGCWAVHSEDWTAIIGPPDEITAIRAITTGSDLCAYGTVVFIDMCTIRFEDFETAKYIHQLHTTAQSLKELALTLDSKSLFA